jgi:Zn2+/Cd2+-exporting ATPase
VTETARFRVQGMDCPDCASKVERGVRQVDGVVDVSTSLMGGTVTVSHVAGSDRDRIRLAIENTGYTVEPDGHRGSWSLPDMECPACAGKVERALVDLEGVTTVTANVMSRKISVSYEPERITRQEISDALRAAGYPPGTEADQAGVDRPFWRDREKVLTAISGLFFFAAIAFRLFGPEHDASPIWREAPDLAGVLFLIAAVLGGFNFLPAAVRALRTLSLDMDFLMAAAIIGAAAIGEYLEAAAIAFLFSTAELLEAYAVDRARNSLRELMRLAPDTATVKRNGVETSVPVEEVARDEIVVVRPGERIPMDGVVEEGASAVDQSPITGESMPVTRQEGDAVFAGTINGEGYLEVRSSRPASESTLSRIIRLVEEAEEHRAPSEQFVRRFSRYYTPVVTVLALGVILIPPLVFGADFSDWFLKGLTLLVIACPCALVISTPVAVVSGITSAARHGVLIKGGNYLEALGDIKVIAFDKTGTLTQGEPEVTDILGLNEHTETDVLRIAAALESRSQHPIGQAVAAKASGEDLPEVTAFESVTGRGVRGQIDGVIYLVGKPDLFGDNQVDAVTQLRREGKTAVLVGTENEVIGAIAVADTVRPEAKAAVAALRLQGARHLVMLTGDNDVTARGIADQLGIADCRAELLPEQKLEAIRELERTHGPVAMVGDGVNDAPALAASSVGIAMGAAGTDAALETADVALMADDLSRLPYLFQLSRAARRVIRQNVAASILIKFGLAAGVFPGLVSLVTAVLAGDMGTSLGVTANALRLARVKHAGS